MLQYDIIKYKIYEILCQDLSNERLGSQRWTWNKEVIILKKVQQSQVINNSSSLIGIVSLDIFWEFVSGYNQTFQKSK